MSYCGNSISPDKLKNEQTNAADRQPENIMRPSTLLGGKSTKNVTNLTG